MAKKTAAKKTAKKRASSPLRDFPKQKGITITEADNGFVISKRDERFREKTFVAKTKAERDRIVKREMGLK